MAGHIRVFKCPGCGQGFSDTALCPRCDTRPHRYHIDLWWQKRLRIFTGKDGYPLDSFERAERLLSAIRYEIDLGTFEPKEYIRKELKSLEFVNYAQAWLERREQELIRRHISRAYMKETRRYVKVYYVPFFGRRSIKDLRGGDIDDFIRQLPPHLAAKSVRNILGILHKLFDDARRRKDILAVPDFPQVSKKEAVTRWIPEIEQEKILRQCREPYRTFFLFLMKQGCRPAEARALRWESIDLKAATVTICAGFDLGEWKPYTKEGEVRVLPLNSRAKEALLRLPRSISGFVFVNSRGVPLSQRMVCAAWQRAAKKAGVPINCYQGTRHSFGTQRAIAGHPIFKIEKAMGHKDPYSTRRYAKMATEALRDLIEGEETVINQPSLNCHSGRNVIKEVVDK